MSATNDKERRLRRWGGQAVPGERPRSKMMITATAGTFFVTACLKNSAAGLPILKRPQMHLVFTAFGVAVAMSCNKAMEYKYHYKRRHLLFDTQGEYRIRYFGTLDQIPDRLPDSLKELDPTKPYWYPYGAEVDEKKKYFDYLGGVGDVWEESDRIGLPKRS